MNDMETFNFNSTITSPVRKGRIASGITQAELAMLSGVSRQNIIDLEAGKNVGLHIIAKVLNTLKINLVSNSEGSDPADLVRKRVRKGSNTSTASPGMQRKLELLRARPRFANAASVWSSPSQKNSLKLLPARLSNASFLDLMELLRIHGIDEVEKSLDAIAPELNKKQYLMQKQMLGNIGVAMSRGNR